MSLKDGTPGSGYWDQHLISKWTKDFTHHDMDTKLFDKLNGAIVVIPGAYQANHIEHINELINKLKWCLLIITSDEENNFPIDSISHSNIKIYSTYPNLKFENVNRWIPIGYPPHAENVRDEKLQKRDLDWSFSGQSNHESRQSLVSKLENMENGELNVSGGFAQGLEHKPYYDIMLRSKVVLAPRGNISPDSFRFYEAIECGAIPIAENKAFWYVLFGDNLPFPIVEDGNWNDIDLLIKGCVEDYDTMSKSIQSWWKDYNVEMESTLVSDVFELKKWIA